MGEAGTPGTSSWKREAGMPHRGRILPLAALLALALNAGCDDHSGGNNGNGGDDDGTH